MDFGAIFLFNNFMLAVGLSMDAFSICIADSLSEPYMEKERMITFASVFSLFQGLMPIMGWFCVNSFINHFSFIERFIPWISFILLIYIGFNMVSAGFGQTPYNTYENPQITLSQIIAQGVATSIDAFSVGFTIADFDISQVYLASCIISVVTFTMCFFGLVAGKKFSFALSDKAGIFGGLILIFIGFEIFISSLLHG